MFAIDTEPLNHLNTLSPAQHRVRHARGLSALADDATTMQSYLAQFQSYWAQARDSLDALLSLPSRLQQAQVDLMDARQAAIDAGLPDVAAQAEALLGDVQAHENSASQVASTIVQYRDTWNSIESAVAGFFGTISDTVAGWWSTAKRAVGLNALGIVPLLPLAAVIAAVAALGGVVVTGLAVLAWWSTTSATIEGVKAKTLPASALGSFALLSSLPQMLLLGGLGLGAVLLLRRR